MATTEAGHHPNRSYVDRDGDIHLNGASLFLNELGQKLTSDQAGIEVTATADGTGTGTIPDGGMIQFVSVTSAGANNIVVLPSPTPGTIVILYVGSNGFELRSSAPATVAINGGTGASAESAIAANQMAVLICTSATTWHGFEITGATLTAVEAAA